MFTPWLLASILRESDIVSSPALVAPYTLAMGRRVSAQGEVTLIIRLPFCLYRRGRKTRQILSGPIRFT
jgi:hypothetical protein